VSDKVIFMDEGRIVESGTAKEAIDDPQDERTKRFFQESRSDEEKNGMELSMPFE